MFLEREGRWMRSASDTGSPRTGRSSLPKYFCGRLHETPACNMASSGAGGFVVLTQVYPQQSGSAAPTVTAAAAPIPAFCTTQHVQSLLEKFLKGETKALGTVQIMIGVTIILLGIVMTISVESLGVYSGIFFWGSLVYISSGALSVAANNKLNKCLVRGALGLNVVSTIIAGIAIILISVDYVIYMIYGCYGDEDSYTLSSCRRYKNFYKSISRGVRGVILLFTILEFIISICVSAFGCKAVCDNSPGQVVYIAPANSQVTSGDLLIPQPCASETAALASVQTEKPPKYDDILP